VAEERKLGRGFDQLLDGEVSYTGEEVLQVPLEAITPNRFQPRREYSDEAFEHLKSSIARDGILQPVVLRPAESGYELIAGERRWRAARDLDLEVIPAIVRQADDERALELALIENIQREDLNPIDRANAYRRLMENFHLTQEDAAERVGQDRSTVANTLRLLDLPEEVQDLLRDGRLTMGHARALLALQGAEARIQAARRTLKEGLSVREVERLSSPKRRRSKASGGKSPELVELEERLRNLLATKVEIHTRKRGGRIVVEYYSNDDLQRIIDVLDA